MHREMSANMHYCMKFVFMIECLYESHSPFIPYADAALPHTPCFRR
jgi:hypothetical protein